jgi:hypothetical protein
VRRLEGQIKADGTTLGHRAKISWSAHWLGDGGRHRPEDGVVPHFGETPMFAELFATLLGVSLCFCVDRLHRCR